MSDLETVTSPGDVTQLLHAWQAGDQAALGQLMPLVYADLQRIARRQMERLSSGQTLDTNAVVHEGYLRIAGAALAFKDRHHFMALMARVMRNLLLDYADAAHAQRRGGGQIRVDLQEAFGVADPSAPALDLIDLDRAISALGLLDRRKEEIVELYFFAGLTRPAIAELIGVSLATVDRDLRMALAWLRVRMEGNAPAPG